MLKKIAIFLFVLLIVQMAMYARLLAAERVNQTETVSTNITEDKPGVPGTDIDIDAYLKEKGIQTSVDEAALNKKYEGTHLITDPVSGSTKINFYNPNARNYKLEIYDVNKGLVATFTNINADAVTIDKDLFSSGAYIFKLEGEENMYCGTFVL